MGKAKQGSFEGIKDDLDLYGSKVYAYNFEGRTNINSLMGVIVSIIVYVFITNFAV
jgi:hypothetical protein